MKSVSVILIGQVIEYVEGQVDIYLIKSSFCLAQLADLFLLRSGFFCLHQGFVEVLFNFECG